MGSDFVIQALDQKIVHSGSSFTQWGSNCPTQFVINTRIGVGGGEQIVNLV